MHGHGTQWARRRANKILQHIILSKVIKQARYYNPLMSCSSYISIHTIKLIYL